jgi:GNAT superfamily N-acetyltransferase
MCCSLSTSYVVRPLSPSEASAAARAWNDLADGTLDAATVERVERLLSEAGTAGFVAFTADKDGELCGLATARVVPHPVSGTSGEIEALMIDARLPDDAGAELASAAIEWLRDRGASRIFHLRSPAAPPAFWERMGFRPEKLRYTLDV